MNRAEAMEQLGADLGVTAPPTTLAGLVAAAGGTRATAGLLGVDLTDTSKEGKTRIASTQRTLQRYLKAERGETGKNVRGQKAEDRKALTDKLRAVYPKSAQAQKQKADADAAHPHGFHAKVKGKFVVSESVQRGRTVKPTPISREYMDEIIDKIQAGDYEEAAVRFDAGFSFSYLNDSPVMSWGEDTQDADAFDSLTID